MSIVKRSNSKFWYIQFQMNGHTFIMSSKTTNKRAAEQMETEWKAKLHAQNFLGHRPPVTVGEAIKQYCESKTGTPSHAGLISSARIVCKIIPPGKKLDEITSHDLEKVKRVRLASGVGSQTIKHNLNLIRGAIKFAKRLGYATAEVEFPSIALGRSPLRYLSVDEETRLLRELEPTRVGSGLAPTSQRDVETMRNVQDAYDLVVLLLDTGARYSEIANIEWRRIDLETRTIHLWRAKVKNEAVLYMTDRVRRILERRRQESTGQHVFLNRKGSARGYATQAIRKAFRRAGLTDCRVHTLRHTHASRLIQNGMSVYEVREVLGHSDIKTTMRYAHLEARQVTSRARDVINRLNAREASAEVATHGQ
ncbi:site-specific integrase [Ramlibacter sp. AW1]|uniref:Site-specific integrase n=1 Tax=Ramlibacter aurantiacus TaxID=2801330 RepID=A0A936ZTP6_9BURK|nr:site-specific integrase [Ramlibacter aurantiacus]MBL0423445.1 site-specific integrase [Ramlibacter aurantiacus]